ncbi:hypothetical protein GIW05_00060 [Pseudomonas syringae]|uniref:energy transducer TonB n=1 Tax=Pseudomonas syringae TaxID=317 RepID=UPI001F4901C8|nr:energy transducer TonB [Pseudomonas syringae]MCF5381915.1 hypothetical protein [Pseudomonas syringae]MCF5424035.1 hypothetical protein [Pseudomonas syringae]MCF5454930.1 hypothetical protein [Pseudomonas syringae]MCF5459246.1 hypothetical protein [Pseudomonas syringae]
MEQQKVSDAHARAMSFLQAKWFPGALSAVALVIAFGGHVFTASNSVGVAKLSNLLEGLQAFKIATQRSDGAQDRAIQSAQTELRNQQRINQQLQDQVTELKTFVQEQKLAAQLESQKATEAAEKVKESEHKAELTKAKPLPLPIGVNERFDTLIRARMKLHWEAPASIAGAESSEKHAVAGLVIRVDRQGTITDVQVGTTSGYNEFDISAMSAALKLRLIPEIAGLNELAFSKVQLFKLWVSPASLM